MRHTQNTADITRMPKHPRAFSSWRHWHFMVTFALALATWVLTILTALCLT
jgi:hypothetical protein